VKKILIVDDDAAVTNYLLVFLTQTERFDPAIVNDSRIVPDLLTREQFDVVLLDMDMPEVSGTDILKLMRQRGLQTPVVVLTGVGGVDLAVRSIKLGAFDYLTKPVDDDHLLEVLELALQQGALHRTLNELPAQPKREDLAHGAVWEGFITRDARMIRLLHEAEKMASGDITVLIIGEHGCGREKLARAIHEASPRRGAPFAALDAAAVRSRDELPAMLFGRARVWQGTTKERPGLLEGAAGGTLFLDSLEQLGIPLQIRLKRVIHTGEFYREHSTRVLAADVRFIVASTLDLTLPEGELGFSKDLLYHLRVNTLRIPPLRERTDDIPVLAEHLMRREAVRAGKDVRAISSEALDALRRYPFPQNDAELALIIASAVIRETSDVITSAALPGYVREPPAGAVDRISEHFEPRRLIDMERDYIARMIQHCGGDREKAAAELGISLAQLDSMLETGVGPTQDK
jgi:DNA-binding NtrC family response regulator